MKIADAAREFISAMRECGMDKTQLPGEYDTLVEAVEEYDRVPIDAVLDGRTNECVCPRCKRREPLPMPIEVDALVAWIRYFVLQHRWCKAAK